MHLRLGAGRVLAYDDLVQLGIITACHHLAARFARHVTVQVQLTAHTEEILQNLIGGGGGFIYLHSTKHNLDINYIVFKELKEVKITELNTVTRELQQHPTIPFYCVVRKSNVENIHSVS